MTYKQKYDKEVNWLERIRIVYLYHCTKLTKHRKWPLINTARYFHISIGLVSEDIFIGGHIRDVGHLDSRTKALRHLGKIK